MVRQRVLVPPFVGSNPTLRTCPFSSVEQSSRLRTYESGVRISQRTLDKLSKVCYYIKVIEGKSHLLHLVDVAELVDALGLGSSRLICEGSSPFIDT